MLYVYIILGAVLLSMVYDWGKSDSKKKWQGTLLRQSDAMDGAYKVLLTKKIGKEVITLTSRHDGQLICLILESDPCADIFKIKDGHVIPFD